MVGLLILVVALSSALGSVSSFMVLEDSNRETALAYTAAQRVLEDMQGTHYREVFRRYNSTAADDLPGSPGPDFAVLGLDPQLGDADGMPGRIDLPEFAPGVLREDVTNADFGLPRDLNGDGDSDSNDHALDYVQLPLRVTVQWRGRSGNRIVELQTVMGAR